MKIIKCTCVIATVITMLAACSNSGDGASAPIDPISYDTQGPYAVANQTISITNYTDGRVLNVELWYPAATAGDSQTIEDFAAQGIERDAISALLSENSENCVTRNTRSGYGLEPARSPAQFPLVAFSHCSECTRFSSFSLAERLASHGIAVAAPDHTLNTLFDPGAILSEDFLTIRANDIIAVIDELLIPNSAALPDNLQGRFDATKIGMAGHSYGAVTTGKVLQEDDRVKAGYIIAAPVENPLIPGVEVSRIAEPTLYLVAREDNSITEIGNVFIRSNFEAAASPSWKVEVTDAGHWSVSDIAGIIPGFQAGCGNGERQTNPGELFTYIDIDLGLEITAAYGMRFFAGYLLSDKKALTELEESTNLGTVDVEMK